MATPKPRQSRKPAWAALALQAGRVFTPSAPVDESSLFAGRHSEVRRVIDVINQTGQHAIIFGERGVGKTSLANVLHDFLAGLRAQQIIAPRVNCDGGDSFPSAWRKAFKQVELIHTVPAAGFTTSPIESAYNPIALPGDDPITVDGV